MWCLDLAWNAKKEREKEYRKVTFCLTPVKWSEMQEEKKRRKLEEEQEK